MGICLKWHGDAGFLVNFTLWCLLTIIVKSFVDVFNSLGPSDAFICVSKLNIIGSDDGLSPTRRQAIIWTNAGILLIRPLRTNFSEIFIEVYTFSFNKMHSKMSSGKWRPFCLGLNVLRQYIQIIHSIHIGDELEVNYMLTNVEPCVSSLRPSEASMCQWTMPPLAQIMACRLFSDKPLSKPMLVYL